MARSAAGPLTAITSGSRLTGADLVGGRSTSGCGGWDARSVTRSEATQFWAANVAAGLAFASAATTACWLLGGTALLDTVGGYPEELARSRSALALVVGVLVVGAKLVAGLLALSLARPVVRYRRLLLLTGSAGALLLSVYGGLLVVVGALVLFDAIRPTGPVDRRC